MSFDPDRIFHEVSKCGDEWVDAKSAYEMLEDSSKSMLASILTDFMDTGLTKSESEVRALASSKWKDYLASKAAARRAYLLAQVRYDAMKSLSENRRSQESTRRAEMAMR